MFTTKDDIIISPSWYGLFSHSPNSVGVCVCESESRGDWGQLQQGMVATCHLSPIRNELEWWHSHCTCTVGCPALQRKIKEIP